MRNAMFHQDTLSSLIEARLRTNTSTVLVYHHVSHRVIGTLMVPTVFPSDRVVTLLVREVGNCPSTVMIPTELSVIATCITVSSSQPAVIVTSRPPNPTSVVPPPTPTSIVNSPHITTHQSQTPVVPPPTQTYTVENPSVTTLRSPVVPSVSTSSSVQSTYLVATS